MSIIGQPQVISTVKSSWEILSTPVPLRSGSAAYGLLRLESSGYNIERKTISPSLPQSSTNTPSNSPEPSVYSIEPKSNSLPLASESSTIGRAKTESTISSCDIEHRSRTPVAAVREEYESNRKETATYVSTQRRTHEDIAETVATEFEQHVRTSQRVQRRELINSETEDIQHLQNIRLREETENTTFQEVSKDEIRSTVSTLGDPDTETQNQRVYEEDLIQKFERQSQNSSAYSDVSRTSTIQRHSSTTHESQPSRHLSLAEYHSDISEMPFPNVDRHRNSRNVGMHKQANERRIDRNSPTKRLQPLNSASTSGQNHDQGRRVSSQGDIINRPLSHTSANQLTNTRSPHGLGDDTPSVNEAGRKSREESRISRDEGCRSRGEDRITRGEGRTYRGTSIISDAARSRPDGVDHNRSDDIDHNRPDDIDHPHVPAPTEPEESFSRQAVHIQHISPPNFHPPPTIVQNGITQTDLLELMSKGLGQFTTEMAVMVIEKLKPEYETFAKQVGAEVKDSTITELKVLRDKLAATETELEILRIERDKLKTENSKERDQMKKEFEKDRLKRVKEFEEKKELIETLQKENGNFKGLLKEKDKMLRKADMKAKGEEQKRLKYEEDAEAKQKELQKELDKAKGELLVQKSKKRLQISSAQHKKQCLGKLNSHHGLSSSHFNGHKPVQYDEGDDSN